MSATASPAAVRGSARVRLHDPLVLGIFVGAFAALVLAGLLALLQARPSPTSSACGSLFCPPPSESARLVNQTVWTSSDLRFSVEFDELGWIHGDHAGPHELELRNLYSRLWIEGAPGTDVQGLYAHRVDELKSKYKDLAEHPASDGRNVLGPSLGYVDQGAIGGAYCGTDGTYPVDVIVMAATDGQISLVMSLTSFRCEANPLNGRYPAFRLADRVLQTIRWPQES